MIISGILTSAATQDQNKSLGHNDEEVKCKHFIVLQFGQLIYWE